ncbi:MAG: type 2 lanthipeptide synthetase LanM family protein [Vicinamibacterales bacterium]
MSAAQLSWNAATLDERLAFVRATPRPAGPDARPTGAGDALEPWARACTGGDVPAFLRRLAWDDVEPAAARAAMAATVPDGFPIAPWTQALPAVMASMKASASANAAVWEQAVARLNVPAPFADIWLPVVLDASHAAFEQVPNGGRWFTDDARLALERHLAGVLSRVSELAVHGLFVQHQPVNDTDGTTRYGTFVRAVLAAGGAPIFSAYPVLARHVVQIIRQWTDATLELARRLEEDGPALEALFGAPATRVAEVRPGLSDRHHDGRQVMYVRFESGLALAYKPRDVALEHAYNETLAWMARAGLPAAPPALRILARETHGWVEWVEPAAAWTRTTAAEYFRQAGALVAAAYVFGGADLHSENLVASSRGPVLVDTEMLLQPSTRPAAPSDGGDEAEPAATSDSCLLSGLVSAVVIDKGGNGFDVGGLQPAAPRELALPARRWVHLRSDALALEPEAQVRPGLRNEVHVDDVVQRPETFAREICDGFAAACAFLHERRAELTAPGGVLASLAPCQVRVLFRPSDQYAAALYLTAAPRYQASGLARSLALETLYRVFVSEVERPRMWPLVAEERAALERLDVPRVTLRADSTSLRSASGVPVEGYYLRSGVQAMRERLAALTVQEQQVQLDLLRAALAGGTAPAAPGPRALDARARLIEAARRIGHTLLERAETSVGGLSWPSSRWRTDLYGGSGGLAVFLSALAAVTGEPAWAAHARQVARPLTGVPGSSPNRHAGPGTPVRLGGCTGQPSVAHALGLCGALLQDDELRVAACDVVCAITPEAVAADAVLDVEGGVAGMLLVLLALQRIAPDDRLHPLAAHCVARLLTTQVREGEARGAWAAGDQPVARPGFAHGAAGIAGALSKWSEQTGATDATDAVRAAWSFERRVAAANGGRYPTVRSDGSRLVMAAWCHGAPGVALGRLLAPATLADATWEQDLQDGLRQTLAAPAGPLDHLCCGNLGRADVALTAGLATGAQAWEEAGRSLADQVALRILRQGRLGMRGRGFQRGAAAPELFQGLAGIGYQLLRTAAPGRVPSLLAFAAPGDRIGSGTIS